MIDNSDPLGACEECLTNSWEECSEEECTALRHPHEGPCSRCGYCFQWDRIVELEKRVAELIKQL